MDVDAHRAAADTNADGGVVDQLTARSVEPAPASASTAHWTILSI